MAHEDLSTLPRTPKEAVALGLNKYFTGKPCPRGHISWRYVNKKKGGEQRRFRYKPDGLRKRRNFRGNTVTQDTRQINLKVVEAGKKPLATILAAEGEEASE